MVSTPNLDIAHLEPNSDQPEVVVNEALDALDAKITDVVTISVGPSDTASLTQDEQAKGSVFDIVALSPGPSGPVTIDFAAFGMGNFTVINSCGEEATLQVSGQSLTPPTLANGANGMFLSDGINVQAVAAGGVSPTTGISGIVLASENLAAGAIVNLHTVAGVCKMQNANATDNTKPAHGFVKAAVISGHSGVFIGAGQIDSAVSGLTPGAVYYLDASAGGVTAVPPSSAGNLVQEVGQAMSAGALAFWPKAGVTL